MGPEETGENGVSGLYLGSKQSCEGDPVFSAPQAPRLQALPFGTRTLKPVPETPLPLRPEHQREPLATMVIHRLNDGGTRPSPSEGPARSSRGQEGTACVVQ